MIYASSANQAISGAISGSGALILSGSGSLTLSGNSIYTGPTIVNNGALIVTGSIGGGSLTVNGGTVQLGNDGSLFGAVVNNASLVFNRSDTFVFANGVSGTGTLIMNGTGTMLLSGSNSYSGATVINQGTLRLAGAPVAGSTAWFDAADPATLATSGSTVTAWSNKGAAGSSLSATQQGGTKPTLVAGALNGRSVINFNNATGLLSAGNINISGSADRTLFVVGNRGPGNNNMYFTHWGPTGSNNLAFGISSQTDKLYEYTWGNDLTFGAQTAGVYQIFDSTLSNGGKTLTGDLISAGVLSTGSKTVTANTTNSKLYLGYRPSTTSYGNLAEVLVYNSALSPFNRTAVDAYLYSKWFVDPSSGILPPAAAVQLNAGATLDLNGASQTVRSLADGPGGGGAVVNNAGNTPVVLTIAPVAESATFSGTIADAGAAGAVSLVVSGSGTQVLTGLNTYSGGTTVSSGTLVAGSGGKLGTGNLTVSNGAVCVLTNTTGAIANTASISLGGSAKISLAPGVVERVSSIIINGAPVAKGVWSAARDPVHFSGSGCILVVTPGLTAQQDWRQNFFNTTANAGNAADFADPDFDGCANLLEYATGSNPILPHASPISAVLTRTSIDLYYPRSHAAVINGFAFNVEWSDTLANDWSTADVTQSPVPGSDDGIIETIHASVPIPSGKSRRFVHLKVSSP